MCVCVFIVFLLHGGLARFSSGFGGYLERYTVYVYMWPRVGDQFMFGFIECFMLGLVGLIEGMKITGICSRGYIGMYRDI